MTELDHLQRLLHPLPDFRLGDFPHAQAVSHVVPHTHVREQRIGLEHGIDVPLEGRERRDRGALHQDFAGRRPLESGDHAQRRGLSRARRAEEGQELSGRDIEREIIDGRESVEALDEVAELENGRDDAAQS